MLESIWPGITSVGAGTTSNGGISPEGVSSDTCIVVAETIVVNSRKESTTKTLSPGDDKTLNFNARVGLGPEHFPGSSNSRARNNLDFTAGMSR
jgi:hypothetical protein